MIILHWCVLSAHPFMLLQRYCSSIHHINSTEKCARILLETIRSLNLSFCSPLFLQRTYVARGLISGLGRRIGVGKEADIYECINDAGEKMVLKIHRSVGCIALLLSPAPRQNPYARARWWRTLIDLILLHRHRPAMKDTRDHREL